MKKVLSLANRKPQWVLLAPFLILSATFMLIPILNAFYISFFDFSFLNPTNRTFVFLDNFRNVLADTVFRRSIRNTIFIVFVFVPAQLYLSLLVAMFINTRIKFKNVFRTIVYLPYVVSPIAIGAIVAQLFRRNTPLVELLTTFGLDNVTWHATRPYAFWLVVLIVIWTQIGFFMVIYNGALKEIPEDLYEAAEIDGAGPVKKFLFITYPLLRHTRFLIVFMSLIVAFQLFELPYLISTIGGTSAGSPSNSTMTIVMYIYSRAFRYNEMGLATAASVILFFIIFLLSLIQNRLERWKT